MNINTESDYSPWMLYLNLEWMHHDLHQHLLVRQEAVQVQALALHSLRIYNQKMSFSHMTAMYSCMFLS